MGLLIGAEDSFLLSITVVLLCVASCTSHFPTSCCFYDALNEKHVIDSSCTDVCILGGGLNFSDCSSASAQQVVQNLVVADFVQISNCSGRRLFPKLKSLTPVGDMPALILTNCNSRKDTRSFESLESVSLDVLDRDCTGTWEKIIAVQNSNLHPTAFTRLRKVAQYAHDICQSKYEDTDAAAGERVRMIYPNTTFAGFKLIVNDENYYLYFGLFFSVGIITICLVAASLALIVFNFFWLPASEKVDAKPARPLKRPFSAVRRQKMRLRRAHPKND